MRARLRLSAFVLGVAGVVLAATAPRAQETSAELSVNADLSADASESVALYLKVFVNNRDTGLVAAFNIKPGGSRIASTRAELAEIGLRVPGVLRRDVFLDELVGVSFDYDEFEQTIYFTTTDAAMLPKIISASPARELPIPERSTGAVLNYAIAAETGGTGAARYSANSVALDGWIYSPFGTLSSTGFYSDIGVDAGFIRQESKFEIVAARKAVTFAIGDVISSSLPWSRPIRMGGVQIRRDFSLRSDLVTNQLLSFSSTSAVPSTVDVFIGNSRAYSTTVEAGPFTLEDLPVYGGTGEAEILIRDNLGRTRRKSVSFFASQNLMKKGVADYSIEAGYAREAYGLQSGTYGEDAVFSGSLRYGLTRAVTIEAHAEAKSGMVMVGFGLTAVPFALGEVSLTSGGSQYDGRSAGFVRTGLRTEMRGVEVNISSLRTQDGFADLAYVTGVDYLGADQISTLAPLLEVPSALDIISLAIPVTRDDRKIGLSVVRSERATSSDLIASISFGAPLAKGKGSFSLFGTHNFETDDSRVAFAMSMSLGKRIQARASVTTRADGSTQLGSYLARAMSDKVGDYGYALQLEKQDDLALAAARGEYRGRLGRVGGEVQVIGQGLRLRGELEGALVFSGGGFGMGNAVRDSFALVDVGIPDVPVYLQNREVTRTGPGGRALVPGLSAYRSNRLSLDINDLPQGAAPGVSAKDVVPARRAGSYVDFQSQSGPTETIVLRDGAGQLLPAGSTVRLNGGKTDQYVGYDGIAWLEGVAPDNTLTVRSDAGNCTARFAGTPGGDSATAEFQTVVCQ